MYIQGTGAGSSESLTKVGANNSKSSLITLQKELPTPKLDPLKQMKIKNNVLGMPLKYSN